MNFGQSTFQSGPSPIGPGNVFRSKNGNSNINDRKTNSTSTAPSTTITTTTTNDPYLTNDFYPLTQAHHQILSALRADESSADADLYRRIASYGSNGSGSGGDSASTGTGHLYHPIDEGEDVISGGDIGVGGISRETNDTEMSNNSRGGINRNGLGFGPTMTSPLAQQQHQQQPQTLGAQWSSSSSTAVSSMDRYCTVRHSHSIPLPQYLTNLLKKTKLSSLMGFLEKGNMVWVSVDDTLYLWEYEHGSGLNAGGGDRRKEDFVTFKVPSGHCIVSVGLVKPKPGVFKDVVEWGLVVTTPEEAILCALARESTNTSTNTTASSTNTTASSTNTTAPSSAYDTHLRLIPTRYVIPTDSVPILTICGAEDGRIFMGGYDGSLYEMIYESSIVSTTTTRSTLYHNTIDNKDEDEDDGDDMATIDAGPSIASSIASGSKRVLSHLVFGPSETPYNTSTTNIHDTTLLYPRPRKCRKVNHTSLAPPIITAFVPGFVLRAASAVFGSGGALLPDTTRCGQIVEMTLDDGRKTLYALTSGGFIHAFDVSTSNPFAPTTDSISSSSTKSSNTIFSNPPTPPKLCATIDVNKSINAYLSCVALGNMSPPRTSGDQTVAAIQFPGGGAGARAGVGGMETARYWKKRAEGELGEKGKKRTGVGWSSGFGSGGDSSSDGGRREKEKMKSCLHPISMHVVPPSESKCLTLVVISAGGLRYYLSVLPDSGTRLSSTSVKPGNRFTLCHVRGPPGLVKRDSQNALGGVDDVGGDWMLDPMGGMGGGSGSTNRSLSGYTKVKSMYASGVTLLAISNGVASSSSSLGNTNAEAGDSIVALTPDYTDVGLRQKQRQYHHHHHQQQQQQSVDCNTYQRRAAVQYNEITPFAGSGVNEIVSLPTMYGSSYGTTTTGGSTNTIPGGRVWDMTTTAFNIDMESPFVWNLFSQSKTPLDGQWSESVVPAIYFPPSLSSTRTKLLSKEAIPTTANSSVEAAQASSSVIGTELRRPSNNVANNNGGLISMAMNLASSMLFLRPFSHGARPNVSTAQQRQGPTYRISRRVGCGASGFSSSIVLGCGDKTTSFSHGRTRPRDSSRSSIRSSTTRGYRRGGSGSGTTRAVPPLPPPILKPIAVPLAEITMQHLVLKLKPRKIAALNSGGLNFFTQSTPIEKLRMALLINSRDNGGGGSSTVTRDGTIKAIFESYGYAEGCAMCLTIAIQDKEDMVAKKAAQAAMNFANRPRMVRSTGGSTTTTAATTNTTQYQSPSQGMGDGHDIVGYRFSPSSLHDGLVALTSRLLRPIWCKPAIVVTKGRTILGASSMTTTTLQRQRRRGGDHHVKMSPAKVELLLDEVTLQDIRQPLAALQELVKDMFSRAVNLVPGGGVSGGGNSTRNDQNTIRDDNSNGCGGGGNFITCAIRYQSQSSVTKNNFRSQSQTQSQTNQLASQTLLQPFSEKDLNTTAILKEERSIHSLYRLISRAVQALNLMSRLRYAHSTPELPEVEFGLLHGLTFSQIVTMKSAQDRIEAVLTHLFSSNQAMASSSDGFDGGLTNITSTSISSVESNNLSSLLSRQCYLYFSIGSRLTYLGFQTAHGAMTQSPLSNMRTELVSSASSYLRRAAKHWYNASLVTGRSLREEENFVLRGGGGNVGTNCESSKSNFKGYEGAFARALECGSPLSRAAAVLMELQDVAGVVDVCLICASNFGGRSAGHQRHGGESSEISNGTNDGAGNDIMLSWEKGLYHRPMMEDLAMNDIRGGVVSSSSQPIRISGNGTNQSNSGTDASYSDARNTCYAILFHHLGALLRSLPQFPDNHALVDNMVSVALSSLDLNFHNELYAYLVTNEYVNTLLRIDSPNLEKWLKVYQKEKNLLWRYYMMHGFYWMAGDVMWKRGCCSVDEEKVCLEERIECLTRAVNYYSAALKNDQIMGNSNIIVSSSSTDLDRLMYHMPPSPTQDEITRIISQINDLIDIAKLQSRALSTIRSSRNASKIDVTKVEALSNTLINVSVLYNEFAAPFALFDLCLLILQTCGYNDNSTIITLWRSILCEEILPCRTSSGEAHRFLSILQRGSMSEEDSVVLTCDDVASEDGNSLMSFEDGKWVTSLKDRVISLGKELYGKGADYALPLEFLAKSLEGLQRVQMKSSDDRSTAWALNTLIEAGASFTSILDAYNSVMETELDPGMRLTHLSSVSEVLMQWVSSAFLKSPGQSGGSMITDLGKAEESSRIQLIRYSGILFQQIDVYKVRLESLIGCNNDDIVRVLAQLSHTEDILRRHIIN